MRSRAATVKPVGAPRRGRAARARSADFALDDLHATCPSCGDLLEGDTCPGCVFYRKRRYHAKPRKAVWAT